MIFGDNYVKQGTKRRYKEKEHKRSGFIAHYLGKILGGFGSGMKPGHKGTTNQYLSMNINKFRSHGKWKHLNGVTTYTQNGICISRINFDVNQEERIINLSWRSGSAHYTQSIRLTTTRQKFGNVRYLFICDRCQNKYFKLYFKNSRFYCRKCHDLTYVSCQESHKFDNVIRMLGIPFSELKMMKKHLQMMY